MDLWLFKQKLLVWLLNEKVRDVTSSPSGISDMSARLSTHAAQNAGFGKVFQLSNFFRTVSRHQATRKFNSYDLLDRLVCRKVVSLQQMKVLIIPG